MLPQALTAIVLQSTRLHAVQFDGKAYPGSTDNCLFLLAGADRSAGSVQHGCSQRLEGFFEQIPSTCLQAGESSLLSTCWVYKATSIPTVKWKEMTNNVSF